VQGDEDGTEDDELMVPESSFAELSYQIRTGDEQAAARLVGFALLPPGPLSACRAQER
jgi:hypothetical protein